MITLKMIQDAQNQIVNSWGKDGEKVIREKYDKGLSP